MYDQETGFDFSKTIKKEEPLLPARFYMNAVINNARSRAEGMAKYDNKEFIEIILPGGDTHVKEVNDDIRTRYAKQYEQFKANQEQVDEGTPLKNWPALNVAQVAELNALKIRTIEQLANYPDSSLHALGHGSQTLKRRAIAFLEAAKDNAYVEKQAVELQKRDEQIDSLKSQLLALSQQVSAMQAKSGEAHKVAPSVVTAPVTAPVTPPVEIVTTVVEEPLEDIEFASVKKKVKPKPKPKKKE